MDLIGVPILLQRMVGLRVIDFLRSACARPAVVVLFLSLSSAVIAGTLDPAGWLDLALHGLGAGVIAAVLVLTVVITSEERRSFVVQPLTQVLERQRHASRARP